MLLDQLLDFLSGHRGADHEDKARLAVLEWALSDDVGTDVAACARRALARLAQHNASPALTAFAQHLSALERGLPTPARRGGAQARRLKASAAQAA